MGLLYSLCIRNRVIVRSVSAVLGLKTLVDTPYLVGFVVASEEVTIPLVSLYSMSR